MAGLHHEVLGHLVRRGAAHVQGNNVFVQGNTPSDGPIEKMNPLEIGIVATTFVIGVVVYCLVKYTIGELIMTLSTVEDQSTTVTVIQHQDPYHDNENEKEAIIDEEIIIAREQPITSKIRRTIHHLTAIGGYKARWRGLGAGMVTSLFIYCLNINYGYALALFPLSETARTILASTLVAVFFSRFHMAWTHIVISPPSPLSWWRRMAVGMFSVKALAIPAAAVALSEYAVVYAARGIHDSFGPMPEHHGQMSEEQARNELRRGLATIAVGVFLYLAVVIPASVTLVRVEASLLPEDVETIVPFDRTLGGAAPAAGQTENIQFMAWYKAAWGTFNKNARIRLLKLYIKLGGVLLMVDAIFGGLILAELMAIGMNRVEGTWKSVIAGFDADDKRVWHLLTAGKFP